MDEAFSFTWDNSHNIIQDEIIIGDTETTEEFQVSNIIPQNGDVPEISSEQVCIQDNTSTYTMDTQVAEEVVIEQWEGHCAEEVVGVDEAATDKVEIPLPMDQDVYAASRPYPCDFCNRRFRKKMNLINHMAAHQRTHRYLQCLVCGVRFVKNSDLINHQKTHEYTEPEIDTKFSIVDHKNSFICQLCGVGFTREKALASHIRIHEGDSPFACKECNKTFWDMRSMEEHWQTVHGDSDKAPPKKENKYGSYSCKICAISFCRQNDLKRHQLNHVNDHSTDESPVEYSCGICGESFADATDLSSHKEEMHSDVYEFQCMRCGDFFADKESLNLHVEEQHSEHGVLRYETKRRRSRGPRQHRNYLHDEDYTERQNNAKSGDQPFSCPECGKRFTTRSSQQIHMRIHTGERPYACSYCHKAFADGGTLRKHERIHTGEKPYACVICPKAFNQRVVLREHIRSHHSGPDPTCPESVTPYSCSVCLDKFATSQDLIVHLIHHCDMNTAMKRPPRIGPRKYMRRSKLKSQSYDLASPEEEQDEEQSDDEEIPQFRSGEQPHYEIDMDARWTKRRRVSPQRRFEEQFVDQEMSTSSTSTPTYLEQNLMDSAEQVKSNSGCSSKAKMIHTEKKPKYLEHPEIKQRRKRNPYTKGPYDEFSARRSEIMKPRTKNVTHNIPKPEKFPVATFPEELSAVDNLLKLSQENRGLFDDYQAPETYTEQTVDYTSLQENEEVPTRKSPRKTKGLSSHNHIDEYTEEWEPRTKKPKKLKNEQDKINIKQEYDPSEEQTECEATECEDGPSTDPNWANKTTRKSSRTKRVPTRYQRKDKTTAKPEVEPLKNSVKQEYEQCEEQVVYETPEDYAIMNGPETVSQPLDIENAEIGANAQIGQIIDPLLEFAEISMQHGKSDFKCEMCSAVFLTRSQLLTHVRVHI